MHSDDIDRQLTRAVPDGDQDQDQGQVLAAVRQALATRGYEPYDDADGAIRLRNCPSTASPPGTASSSAAPTTPCSEP
jgi:hypothetical protein